MGALALLVVCAGCGYGVWSYSGPLTRDGVGHGLVAAGATGASKLLTGNPKYGAVGACFGYIFKEWEESRGFTYFPHGRRDVYLDMVVPCAVGAALSIWLGDS